MQTPNDLPQLSELMTLSQYADRVNVSHATAWRHCAVGIAGVRLRSVRLGSKRMTTEAWIVEFADAVARAKEEQDQAAPVPVAS